MVNHVDNLHEAHKRQAGNGWHSVDITALATLIFALPVPFIRRAFILFSQLFYRPLFQYNEKDHDFKPSGSYADDRRRQGGEEP
jgi:hypothetical protein